MIPVSLAIVLIVLASLMAAGAIVVAGEMRAYGAVMSVIAAIISWYLSLSFLTGNVGSTEIIASETIIEDGGNLTRTLYEEITVAVTDPGLAAMFTAAAIICSLLAAMLLIMAGIELFQVVDE